MTILSGFYFNNPDNYQFDSNKIEIVSGAAKLKLNQIDSHAHYKLNETSGIFVPDSSSNARNGTCINMEDSDWVAGKISNCLQFDGVNEWVNCGNIARFERTDPASYELWFQTSGVVTQALITKASGMMGGRELNIQILGTGEIVLKLINSIFGSNMIYVQTTNGGFNDGAWHHLVVTYDGSSNANGVTFYIDNVIQVNNIIRNNLTNTILSNNNFGIASRSGSSQWYTGLIDEVLIYEKELSVAEVDFRWNSGNGTEFLPTGYDTANPIIMPVTSLMADALYSFIETVTKTGSDDIKYTILIDGIEKYYNGLIWTESFGYAHTNDVATIQSNLASLDISMGANIKFVAYLHSDDGFTTPEIDYVEIQYDFSMPDITSPIMCVVYGYVHDNNNVPVKNVRVSATLCKTDVYNKEIIISSREKTTITNSFGEWELNVAENGGMLDANSYYIINFKLDLWKAVKKIIVPAQASVNFGTIIVGE